MLFQSNNNVLFLPSLGCRRVVAVSCCHQLLPLSMPLLLLLILTMTTMALFHYFVVFVEPYHHHCWFQQKRRMLGHYIEFWILLYTCLFRTEVIVSALEGQRVSIGKEVSIRRGVCHSEGQRASIRTGVHWKGKEHPSERVFVRRASIGKASIGRAKGNHQNRCSSSEQAFVIGRAKGVHQNRSSSLEGVLLLLLSL